ncbi:MAG: hypothetical protein AAFR41_02270 [Pseudomonadota bacterium]
MLSRAFLLHAFSIVPFTRWPVLIWHLLMVSDWMARLAETGQPVPKLIVAPTGVIYRLEWDGPGTDHWRARLHAVDLARCADAVSAHLQACHRLGLAAHAACAEAMATPRAGPTLPERSWRGPQLAATGNRSELPFPVP